MKNLRCFTIAAWAITYKIDHDGCSPTVDEISRHFCISKATTQRHLEQLEYEFHMCTRKDGKLVFCTDHEPGGQYLPPAWYAEAVLNTV